MSAKSPSNLPHPDTMEGAQVGPVIPPERAALEMAKAMSSEFQALLRTNLVQTQARIDLHKMPPPFPPLEVQRDAGLQLIKSSCDEFNRAWRVKAGVFRGGLILASVATYDEKLWYHVSFSLRDKIPSYEQALWVRTVCFAASFKVIQVFPPVEEHYSFHPNCLHLWSCLEGDGLPDFRSMGMV